MIAGKLLNPQVVSGALSITFPSQSISSSTMEGADRMAVDDQHQAPAATPPQIQLSAAKPLTTASYGARADVSNLARREAIEDPLNALHSDLVRMDAQDRSEPPTVTRALKPFALDPGPNFLAKAENLIGQLAEYWVTEVHLETFRSSDAIAYATTTTVGPFYNRQTKRLSSSTPLWPSTRKSSGTTTFAAYSVLCITCYR